MTVRGLLRVLFVLCLLAAAGSPMTAIANDRPGVEMVFAKPVSRWSLTGVSARTFRPEVAYRITFAENDARLGPRSAEMLDKLAAWIIANPTMPFAIMGHQDAAGAPERNIELAIDRAQAVANYLVAKGVPAERVKEAWALGAELAGAGAGGPVASSSSGAQPKSRPDSGDGTRRDNRDKDKNGNKGRN